MDSAATRAQLVASATRTAPVMTCSSAPPSGPSTSASAPMCPKMRDPARTRLIGVIVNTPQEERRRALIRLRNQGAAPIGKSGLAAAAVRAARAGVAAFAAVAALAAGALVGCGFLAAAGAAGAGAGFAGAGV